MDESVEQIDSGEDRIAPIWRDTAVNGGECGGGGDQNRGEVHHVGGGVDSNIIRKNDAAQSDLP